MSVLARALRRPTERRAADPPGAAIPRPSELAGGWGAWTRDGLLPVEEATAMRFAAFWAAHNLICDQVATTPVDEFRATVDGPVEVVPHQLLTRPSELVSREEWMWGLVSSLLLHGNAWGWVTALDADGWPATIELLDPLSVQVLRPTRPGEVWRFRVGGVVEQRWPAGRLWHLAARVRPGAVVGEGVLARARTSLHLGLAAAGWAAAFFEDGAHPTLLLRTDAPIDQQQAEQVKERVKRVTAGRREPLVLGQGWTTDTVQITPEDAQFLAAVHASALDVARWFGVPPEFIGAAADGAGSVTYANIESRFLHLRQVTLSPWFVRIEKALTDARPRGRFVRFNRDAVVAVDVATRYAAHERALRSGWLTPNEVRRIEDRQPLPGGDRWLWPPYASSMAATAPPAPPPPPPSRRSVRAGREGDS